MRRDAEDDLLDAILDRFAERLADKLTARGAISQRRAPYATAKNNPIGSSRAFLDAARRGAFPSFKRAREVAARWDDVERYIESRKRPARVQAEPAEDDQALLRRAGLRLRAANEGGPRR